MAAQELQKMKGAKWTVCAVRAPSTESVELAVEASGAHAFLFLTRNEAWEIAAELQRQADWLKDLRPELPAAE